MGSAHVRNYLKIDNVGLMRQQNELFRQYGRGPFGELLRRVVRHPTMLVWLDGNLNRVGAPNENFAREVMELFALGIGNYGEDDVLEAARAALATVRDSGDPQAVEQSWLTEASVLREAGDQAAAYAVLTEAVERLPESISIRYSRALVAAESKRVADAERDLRVVLEAQPDNAAALNALGYTLTDLTDRHDEAETLIRRAYQLQPNEASIVDSMGWVAYRQGRLDEALRFLGRAWELDRNPEIAAHLGEVLWFSDRREEALSIWREGADIDPDNAVLRETLERLGVTL